MPKVFLVLNPATGLIPMDIRRRRFENHFKRLGWEYNIYITIGQEDLAKIVRAEIENGVDLIVASGGDGTISGVASGMIYSEVPLGILPTGTANLFARDVGIPIDLIRSLRLLTNTHKLLEVDLMQVQQKACVMNVSVGLSARTILQTERQQKRHFGILAYIWNVISNLIGLHLDTYHLNIDGHAYKVKASEIMVTNSSLIGIRTLQQNINIVPFDGKVEVCIFRARTLLDWLAAVGNVFIGYIHPNPTFRCIEAEHKITVNSKHKMLVQGDGELLGNTPIEVNVLPRALRVIVPHQNDFFHNLPLQNYLKQNSLMAKFRQNPNHH